MSTRAWCLPVRWKNSINLSLDHYYFYIKWKSYYIQGLWIIRCCDSCNIIGSIKGSKEFKGAHWHCYGCRNGFNRRDEALKHFRTHFKNPRTTFQIQVVQDVNQKLLEMNKQNNSANQRLQDEAQLIISIAPGIHLYSIRFHLNKQF